ncbi:MAG: glycosyltransferase family 8 protein [Patescibacteria group bacterium]
MKSIPIILSCDDRYAVLLGTCLCSLFENKKGDYSIDIYIIDSGLSDRSKERLHVLEKRYGFSIQYVTPNEEYFGKVPIHKLAGHYRLPIQNYHRLALGQILPLTCRKAINLDVDTVVRGDIAEFYNLDLQGKTMGVVADPDPDYKMNHLRALAQAVGVTPPPTSTFYFNSGIMLVDVERWRNLAVQDQALDIITAHPNKLSYHDQDALNIVLWGDCLELPPRYNLITDIADKLGVPDPLIVHYSGGGKPWYFFSAMPFHADYLRYVKMTPWKGERYRKFMDVYFARKYGIYPIVWRIWVAFKKIRLFVRTGIMYLRGGVR